jgi:NAD(P)-dependent dehydrogenase (short-subunit alcohol dehydrogenase family)
VAATGRRIGRLEYLNEKYGSRVRTIEGDVTDPGAARAAVAETLEAFGQLDILVNNAGYANGGSLEEMPDTDFRAQIETNLLGVVNVTKAALPVLRRQRSGHILQFSSIGGRVGNTPSLGAYQTAKFAVEGYSGVRRDQTPGHQGHHHRTRRIPHQVGWRRGHRDPCGRRGLPAECGGVS